MMIRYFIIINNVQQGPFSFEELRRHSITSDTLVWTEGMAQWLPAWQIDELKPLFYGRSSDTAGSVPPPPPPFTPSGHVSADGSTGTACSDHQAGYPSDSTPKRCRPVYVWSSIILLGLVILMAITNPSKENHQAVIRENATRALSKAIGAESDDILSIGLSMFDKMLATPIINEALDHMLHYHNYVFFSTTSIETKDGNTTTSYGVLGKVFTADEENMADYITSALNHLSANHLAGNNTPDSEDGGKETNTDDGSDQTSVHPNDTVSLSKQIGNAVIDHIGRQVKRQICENTDSTISGGIGNIIDDVINFIKGL